MPHRKKVDAMPFQDDSDMKIVGEYVAPEEIPDTTSELLEQEQQNGNLDRARALGAALIDAAKNAEAEHPSENTSLRLQRWLLLLFTADVELHRLLPNPLVAQTSANTFYNLLHTQAEDIYDAVQQDGSLSFYYLCQEDGTVSVEKAGQTFASLCGHANERVYVALGQKLAQACLDYVRDLVEQQNFVD